MVDFIEYSKRCQTPALASRHTLFIVIIDTVSSGVILRA